MRSTFFRDVIYPIWFIIFFVFTIGYSLSSKGDTVINPLNLDTNGMNRIDSTISTELKPINGTSVSVESLEVLQNKINRLENVINSKSNLRKAYHGGAPTIHFETNLETKIIQRLDKYPDGYIHIEKGAERKLLTAEESTKQIVKRKNIKNSRIEGLKTRIATLEKASDAQSKANLEQCKRILERLERTSNTNYVDLVVTPQTTTTLEQK